MKKIIYTQRVELVESYGERRDCADVEIAKLIWECGFLPVPVNNIPEKVQIFLEQVNPDGMILTGEMICQNMAGTLRNEMKPKKGSSIMALGTRFLYMVSVEGCR